MKSVFYGIALFFILFVAKTAEMVFRVIFVFYKNETLVEILFHLDSLLLGKFETGNNYCRRKAQLK